ncbi:MAG: hypothetical protein AAGK04_11515 [Planctomycetota bacterium]
MTALDDDTVRLVVSTANRLRLVQADLADQAPEVRQEHLLDEIERALGSLRPEERPAFLDELQGRFPTWEAWGPGSQQSDGEKGRSDSDERELNDAAFLTERLVSLAGGMGLEQRRKVADRLAEVGIVAEGRGELPDRATGALKAAVKIDESSTLDASRVVEALRLYVELGKSLDTVVWGAWKQVAPRSSIRGQGELMEHLKPYLLGDEDAGRGDLMTKIERLRQIVAALVAAIPQTGRQFAQRHYERYAPEHIEGWSKGEKKTLESSGVAAWRKYKEVFGSTDQATMEQEILDLIGMYAQKLVKGLES